MNFYARTPKAYSPVFPLRAIKDVCFSVSQGVGRNLIAESDTVLLKVKNILGERGIDYENVEFISDIPESKILHPGDIISPFIGEAVKQLKFSIFERADGRFAVDNNCGIMRPNQDVLLPRYLQSALSLSYSTDQILQLLGGGGVPFLGAANAGSIKIPLPPLDVQSTLVAQLEAARTQRQDKLAQADGLLAGLDAYLLDQLGLTAPPKDERKYFAVRLGQLDGPLNPERYLGMYLAKAIDGATIEDAAYILENKISPAIVDAKAEWDWIRIDDLPNRPLAVSEMRTQLGGEIDGSFFQVQENDILLARLGPTIQNAKFILCPPLVRPTVASAEFLVLRCREDWNPVVVLWLLRTQLFRQLIYSKARGGTPSRYRVSRDDLAELPFPNVHQNQNALAREITKRLEQVKSLRLEAEAEWSAAKAHFEAQLLDEEEAAS